jgi:hypothetical protein
VLELLQALPRRLLTRAMLVEMTSLGQAGRVSTRQRRR